MEVINTRNTEVSTYSFEARDWKVTAEFLNGNVSFRASYDGELVGIVIMSYQEALILASSIDLFFIEGKRGKEFNNSVKPVFPQGIPMLRIQYTNWGEPFDEGLQFEFSEDFENYQLENMSFKLVDYDSRTLIDIINLICK